MPAWQPPSSDRGRWQVRSQSESGQDPGHWQAERLLGASWQCTVGFHGRLSPSGSPPGSQRPRLLLFQVGAAPGPAVSELELPPAATGTVTVTSESVGPESAGARPGLGRHWLGSAARRTVAPARARARQVYATCLRLPLAWHGPAADGGPRVSWRLGSPGPVVST